MHRRRREGPWGGSDAPSVPEGAMSERVADADPEPTPKPVVRKFKPGGGAKPAPAPIIEGEAV